MTLRFALPFYKKGRGNKRALWNIWGIGGGIADTPERIIVACRKVRASINEARPELIESVMPYPTTRICDGNTLVTGGIVQGYEHRLHHMVWIALTKLVSTSRELPSILDRFSLRLGNRCFHIIDYVFGDEDCISLKAVEHGGAGINWRRP